MHQSELREPLFLALGRLGGAATKKEALVVIEELVADQLGPDDWRLVDSHEPRWENFVAFERQKLKERGLVLNLKRNEWRLSEVGWAEYERIEAEVQGSDPPVSSRSAPMCEFKPKDDSDYISRVSKMVLVKSRSHETLVTDFAHWADGRGFATSSPHPQDLMLQARGRKWIVEAKVLYHGNAQPAVRDALSQLYDYRYSLHDNDHRVGVVALFSETIGPTSRASCQRAESSPCARRLGATGATCRPHLPCCTSRRRNSRQRDPRSESRGSHPFA